MHKVSIIIPVYNTSRYIRQCFDSLIAQTLDDFEVICVNDGSTDSSLKILQEYSNKDSRFIIIDKENEGPGIARNIAIQRANSEYLICVDSDDWLENNALELAYNKIKQDKADVLFYNVYRHIEKKKKKYLLKYTETYKNFKDKPFSPEDAGKILYQTSSLPFKMYNTQFLKTNNIEYSNHKFMEDAIFYIKSLLFAKKLTTLSVPIYNYRVTDNSTSRQYKLFLRDMPSVYEKCFKLIEDENVTGDILESFLENRKNSLLCFYGQTPLYKKSLFHNMAKDLINKHFNKYPLDENLEKIIKTNFLTYFIKTRLKTSKCVCKTYDF